MRHSWIEHIPNYAGHVNKPISEIFFKLYSTPWKYCWKYHHFSQLPQYVELFVSRAFISFQKTTSNDFEVLPVELPSSLPSVSWSTCWVSTWISLEPLSQRVRVKLTRVEGQWSWKTPELLEFVEVFFTCFFLSLLRFLLEKNQSKGAAVVPEDNISNYQERLVESLGVLLGMVGLHLQNGHCN